MRTIYQILLGLFVLCTFTAVNASTSTDTCDLKTFNVDYKFPANVSNYGLTLTNYGTKNIKLVAGSSWQFFVDSSLNVPSITIKVDPQTRTIYMDVDNDASNDNIKAASGSATLIPSATVLMAGLALCFGTNKKYLLIVGLFLCFAASVMAFNACNTVLITYPSEMTAAECDIQCVDCEKQSSRATRDTCDSPTIAPGSGAVPTNAATPATNAPTTATKAPTTAPVNTPAPTSAPVNTAAPTNAAPAPATAAPTPAQTSAPTTAPTSAAPPTAATTRPISVPTPGPTSSGKPDTCTNYIQSGPSQYYNNAHLCTTSHLPYTLSLSSNVATLEQQVDQIMALSSYNDATVYSPSSAASSTYQASFYPQQRLYNNNPTQILIGLTDVTHSLNLMTTKLRMPSIYFGMYLAYTMDHFGIDPHFLLAQAGKEAAATMVDPGFTSNFLTCANSDIANGGCSGKVYDCRANYNVGNPAIQGVTHQGCPAVDNFGIALGPFQIETEGFAQVASVAPHRFWVETAGRTAANTPVKTPLYMDSGSIALKSTNIKSLQANYTSHNSDTLAVVGAGLYHHWVHNVLMSFPLENYRAAFDVRNSAQQAELAFATILYLYNRGMYSTLDFSTCKPTDDPTSSPNCVTSLGYGEYAQQIKAATFALDQATNVYDFPIQWSDVEFFINQLELTYPYQCVSCDLDGSYGNIDWDELYCEAYLMYEKIAAARALKYNANVQTGISFRYDWRLMLAVIRSFLPGRDIISGPDFAPWSVRAGANGIVQLASDPGPYAAAPFNGAAWVAPAGQRSSEMAQCPCDAAGGAAAAPTAAATSASSATPAPTPAPTSAKSPAPTSASKTGSSTCPHDGTICTQDCATTYNMCSSGTMYAQQNVPPGTKCYQGAFVHSDDPRCAGH